MGMHTPNLAVAITNQKPDTVEGAGFRLRGLGFYHPKAKL